MNTLQILRKLECVPSFLGVFPRDKLPTVNAYPSFLIINTDKSSDPGEHWVAIHFSENTFGEYFDSFGLPPIHTSIVNFLTQNTTLGFIYNNTTLQHMFSDACGNYCVFFVYMRTNGYSMCDVLNIPSKNLHRNDSFVKHVTSKKTMQLLRNKRSKITK